MEYGWWILDNALRAVDYERWNIGGGVLTVEYGRWVLGGGFRVCKELVRVRDYIKRIRRSEISRT